MRYIAMIGNLFYKKRKGGIQMIFKSKMVARACTVRITFDGDGKPVITIVG